MDPEAREQYEGEPWFALAERFADDWDQTSFDPDYPTQPLAHFEPLVRRGLRPAPTASKSAASPSSRRATRPRGSAPPCALQRLAVDQALREFDQRFPDLDLGPVVGLICAYEEADNIGDVLKSVPEEACGLGSRRSSSSTAATTARDRVALEIGCADLRPAGQPGPRGGAAGRLPAVRRPGRPLRRDPRRRRAERPGRAPGHAPAPRGRRGRLRGRLPAPRGRPDERRVPQGRGGRLRHRDQPADRDAPHRHLQRLPGPADGHAGRRRRPLGAGPVPDRRAADHGASSAAGG